MGREARVTRDAPKTPKVEKPAKKRYAEHLKRSSVDAVTDGHLAMAQVGTLTPVIE